MRTFDHFVIVSILAALVLAEPRAQVGPLPPPAPAEQKPKPKAVLVDTVLATVNDAAIMLSAVRIEVAGDRRFRERQMGRKLTRAENFTLLRRHLDNQIDKHALAQSAKSFGFLAPEQVEQLFADEMKREEAAQVRDLGTWQEFSRELERTGRTYQTYWREQRVEKMSQFATDFAIRLRMQKQSNLFLTPRMLRETYRDQKDLFVRGAMSGLAIAMFRGPDAKKHAEAAAKIWASEELSPAQVIARVPGANGTPLRPLRRITEESRASLATELVDFALAGPLMKVSAPMQIGEGFHVAKIMAYLGARNGKFEDLDVQLELRQICLDGVIGEFTKQALARAADRTEVWKSQIFK